MAINASQTPGHSTEALLDDVVRRIVSAVQPVRIVLFGSAARGAMGPHSDLDLLVIVKDGTHRRRASEAICRALRGVGVPKDVVVATVDDVREYGDNYSLVLSPALEEGRQLYAANE